MTASMIVPVTHDCVYTSCLQGRCAVSTLHLIHLIHAYAHPGGLHALEALLAPPLHAAASRGVSTSPRVPAAPIAVVPAPLDEGSFTRLITTSTRAAFAACLRMSLAHHLLIARAHTLTQRRQQRTKARPFLQLGRGGVQHCQRALRSSHCCKDYWNSARDFGSLCGAARWLLAQCGVQWQLVWSLAVCMHW